MAHLIRMPRAAWRRQPQGIVEPVLKTIRCINFSNGLYDAAVKTTYANNNLTLSAGSGIFNGSSSYIEASNSVLGIASGYALVCQFIARGYSNTPGLLHKDNSSVPLRIFQFRIETSGAVGFIRFNSSNSIATNLSGGQCTIGKRHTAVAVYTGSGSMIYLDGRLVASDTVTTANHDGYNSSVLLYIGCGYSGPTDSRAAYFNGNIYLSAVLPKISGAFARSLSENPWQLFTPAPSRFILISDSGGSTTHDVALILAANTAFTPIGNADYQAGITFSTLARALSDKSAQFNTALTLDTNVSLTLARAMSTLASVSIGMTADQSANATNAAVAALTESIACSYTSQVTANLLSALSFAISQSLATTTGQALAETLTLALQASSSTSAIAAYSAQTTLLSTVAAALQAALSTSASLTLPATLTVLIDGEKLGSGDVSLSLSIQTGVTNTATAMMGVSVTLATQLLATPAGVGTFHTALSLSNQLSTLFANGSDISGSLSFAVSLAMADAVTNTLGASLDLGAVLSQVQSVIASLNATTEFPLSLTNAISGGLSLNADCELSWSLGFNSDGAYFEITVTLPTGRVVVIQASDRMINITQTERLISIL